MSPPRPPHFSAVQLAQIAANTAQTRQDVEAIGTEVGQLHTAIEVMERNWTHYAPKIDELLRAVKGYNGEPGLVAQVLVLRTKLEERLLLNAEQHEGIVKMTGEKEKRLEEKSIDWKWLAGVVLQVIIGAGMLYIGAHLAQLPH